VIYTVVPILVVFVFRGTLVVENRKGQSQGKRHGRRERVQWGWKFHLSPHRDVVIGQTTQDPTMVIRSTPTFTST